MGNLLYWALVFLVIAIVAALFGFGGVAGTAMATAVILPSYVPLSLTLNTPSGPCDLTFEPAPGNYPRLVRHLELNGCENVVPLHLAAGDAPGRVTLYFIKKPGMDLKEWVVLDAQGLETRVEVSELNKTEDLDAKLFVWESNILKQ